MSNWASITSADFAEGAFFHQPTSTDIHPALRTQPESTRSRSSTATEQVPESITASDSSYDGPDTPTTIGDLSTLQLDGGADKVPLNTDVGRTGLIPIHDEKSLQHRYMASGNHPMTRSPPKSQYSLFPPSEPPKNRVPISIPQRTPSNTSSHTSSFSESTDFPRRSTFEYNRNIIHARSMSHDGQWAIQPDHFYSLNRATGSPSPPMSNYVTATPTSHPDQRPPPPRAFSPSSSGSEWGAMHKPKNSRSLSLPVASFKKFLKKGSTPLVEAAKIGDYNELLRLLAPGPQTHPISGADKDGFTPLHHAVRLGYVEIARALILRHADLEACTKSQDRTPLWFAVHAGHAEIVEMLLEHKADPNYVSKLDGATPLHKASQLGDTEIMRLLIERGADVNLRDVEGMPPLMWATQSKRMDAARLLIEQGAALETRIKLGANLELASKEGMTVLQKAVNTSDHPTARIFLEMGADPNCWGPHGLKPLHKAASRGDVTMCTLLINAGAEVGTRTPDGWTALHFAARYGHEDVADLLIKNGCEPLVVNGKGETAKELAERYGYHNIV